MTQIRVCFALTTQAGAVERSRADRRHRQGAVLCAERLAELAGTRVAGAAIAAFTAGVVLPVIAAAAAEGPADLPPQVIFLPSLWMLVPGAIGLTAVTALLTTRSADDLTDVVTAITAVLAVSLGILPSSRVLAPRQARVGDPGPG
jgi:uncharacterized membrane protein YjjB (DUF3815 family)